MPSRRKSDWPNGRRRLKQAKISPQSFGSNRPSSSFGAPLPYISPHQPIQFSSSRYQQISPSLVESSAVKPKHVSNTHVSRTASNQSTQGCFQVTVDLYHCQPSNGLDMARSKHDATETVQQSSRTENASLLNRSLCGDSSFAWSSIGGGSPLQCFGSDGRISPGSITFDISDVEDYYLNDANMAEARSRSSPMLNASLSTLLQGIQAPLKAKCGRNSLEWNTLQASRNSPMYPQANQIRDGAHSDPATYDGSCIQYLFPQKLASNAANPIDGHTSIEYASSAQDLSAIQTNSDEMSWTINDPSSCIFEELGQPTTVRVSSPHSTSNRQQPPISRKVKSETSVPVDEQTKIPSKAHLKAPKSRAKGRMPHNQVERKYRESLNSQLEALRRIVPSLRSATSSLQYQSEDVDFEDWSNRSTTSKPSKAMILANATSYIRHLEQERQRERVEIDRLKERLGDMNRLVTSGMQSN